MYLADQLFSDEEYRRRRTAVHKRMSDRGLAALVVTDPANICYLTGYNAWSFYTPQMLWVPADGPMIFYSREMDARGAHRTSWLPDDQVVGYPETYVQRPDVHPFDWVGRDLRERGLVVRGDLVGIEMDAHFFSPKAYLALVGGLPEWTAVDSGELVNWVRSVKCDAEIELMRKAAAVCTGAMLAAVETIDVGVRQCDAAAAISQAQITGTRQAGGDYPAIVPLLPTGPAADTPHLTWHQGVFADDVAVVVELAGVHNRYHCPMARTVALGTVSPEIDRVAGVTAEGLDAVLAAVRPGIPTRELARIWNDVLARNNLAKASRLGYSIGLGYPPDWGERTISIRAEDETILEPNMTFHVICGMWLDNAGFELSESIRVTDDGVETFTDLPRELLRKSR